MSAAHTPTPWVAREQTSKEGASLGWIIEHANGRIGWSSFANEITNEGEEAPYPTGAANAEFIIRCVNAHDDLAAALRATTFLVKMAQGIIGAYLPPDGMSQADAMNMLIETFDGPDQREAERLTLAALAKAEAQS